MYKLPAGLEGTAALRKLVFIIVLTMLVAGLVQSSSSDSEAPQTETEVIILHGQTGTRADDCASCHYTIKQAVDGGKHSWSDCTMCHDSNSTGELVIIMECTACHTPPKHDDMKPGGFVYPECMTCHDQHATDFQHDIANEVCATCHGNASSHLDMGPHGWQDCTNCHSEHNSTHNSCDSCHGVKHTDEVAGGYIYPECIDCHNPMEASFKHNLTNDVCQDCHSSEYQKLQTGGHSEEECNECHDEHMVVTKTCDECHGEYHGYSYPKCLECHEPMHASSATPEEDLTFSVLTFSIIAILVSVILSIVLVLYSRRSGEEPNE
jgi:hypothetical protein